MRAGFARVRITPPVGTTMMGFGGRDRAHGCDGVHDDIYVRTLWLEHGGETVVIAAFDLCFFGREEADRYRGAIGRRFDLAPRQVMLNTSHTHVGPATATWSYAGYVESDRVYLHQVELATLRCVAEARDVAREVTVWAGAGRSRVPLSRRKLNAEGQAEWRPWPEGTVCESLPVCLLKDTAGEPVSLVFSVSCHPSTIGGWLISADYPGVAAALLDEHIGAVGTMFLQGTGGDAKACVIGDAHDDVDTAWRQGTWDDVAEAGRIAADEVKAVLDHLTEVEPDLCAREIEMHWPLEPHIGRDGFAALLDDENDLKRLWAARQIEQLDRGVELPSAASITAHGVKLGRGVRMVGLEGEAVAGLGLIINEFYGGGVTFPLGYTDGAQLYLPTTSMLDEGGYEVESFHEYGFPSRFKPGIDDILRQTLGELRERGVD